MTRVSLKGVAIGGAIDIVATNIAAIPIIAAVMFQKDLTSLPAHQQTAVLTDTLNQSTLLFGSLIVLGSLCSILGGYIAAKIAKRSHVLNGALSAFLCVGLGIYSVASGSDTTSPWGHVGFFLLSPALGALGGYVGLRRALDTPPAVIT